MVKPGMNTVADDLIWKDHVSKEWRYAKKWPENWGFLGACVPHMQQNNEVSQKTPLAVGRKEVLKLPHIKTNATTIQRKKQKPFPVTTSGFIGWKSSNPDNNLDKYGNYSTPIKTFLRQMNWTADSLT